MSALIGHLAELAWGLIGPVGQNWRVSPAAAPAHAQGEAPGGRLSGLPTSAAPRW
jgi:hypothetical protein